jgi:hypothetical protein
MIGSKLQVGILASTENLPAWLFYIIEQLQASDYAQVSSVIQDDPPGRQNLTRRIIHTYLKVERRPAQTQTEEEIKSLLDGIPLASASDPNLPTDTLDLILHLGAYPAPSHLAQIARFGLWEISDGEYIVHADDIPGFFEVLQRKPITNCVIMAADGEANRIVQQGSIATDPSSISRNRENFFWKAAFLLLKGIRTLHKNGKLLPEAASEIRPRQHSGSRPNILDLMCLAVSQVSRFAIKKIRKKIYLDKWILMLAKSTDEIENNWDAFRPLYPPSDRFWADPFILKQGNRYYVFIEELPYKTNRGHIACMILDEDGNILENRPILEKPYHLSYPFIFEYEGTFYMVPETGENRTIDTYRCISFPFEWEYHKTLMSNVEAKDATLMHYRGKWWLFVTVREHKQGSTWDQLSIFWADTPLSDKWTPHPLNPVVNDVRTARPAGHIFFQNGDLIRPSQDCSVRYGYALNFNRITKLSETEYEEVPEGRLEPPGGTNILATHTFNKVGEMTIIDAVIRRRR